MLLIPNGGTFAGGGAGYQKKEKRVVLLAELTTEYTEVYLKPRAGLGLIFFFFFDRWVTYAAGFQFYLEL